MPTLPRLAPPCRCLLALLLLLPLGACRTTHEVGSAGGGTPPNDLLASTLWVSTAAEFEAAALQAYRLAAVMLDSALASPAWTAAVEQTGAAASLPPAVVVDVDETVLDNSAYQARLVRDDALYSSATWTVWVDEARAEPIPGAVDFLRHAAARGVQVIYLTNRRAEHEAATRRNLEALGFPIDKGEDVVLTRGERPAWAESDKASRRAAVAERYRIVMLVGDNLGDFLPDVERSVAERAELVGRYRAYWGTRWIVIPNPMYGSWDDALFDFDYSLSPEERRARKWEALPR